MVEIQALSRKMTIAAIFLPPPHDFSLMEEGEGGGVYNLFLYLYYNIFNNRNRPKTKFVQTASVNAPNRSKIEIYFKAKYIDYIDYGYILLQSHLKLIL